MDVNPFKEGSQRRKIAERILKGDSNDKIVKDLKLKSKHPIYALNTAWKKIKAKAKTEEKKPPLDPNRENQDAGSETVKGSEIIQHLPIPPRIGDPQGTVVHIEGFAPGKQVFLTANNILFFQWFKNKHNYEGDLSDFLNDAIEDFFRARNWKIKIVKEEVFV